MPEPKVRGARVSADIRAATQTWGSLNGRRPEDASHTLVPTLDLRITLSRKGKHYPAEHKRHAQEGKEDSRSILEPFLRGFF